MTVQSWLRSLLERPDQRGSRPNFADIDDLGRMIQKAIERLEARREIEAWYDGPPPRFNGYCARACAAYVYLAKDTRTRPYARHPAAKVKFHKEPGAEYGDSHYWLETRSGIMDLIFGPGERPSHRYPYDEKRGRGFPPSEKGGRYPQSHDARKIMDEVWSALTRPSG